MDDLTTLVRAAQAGDRNAFDEIVRRFQDCAVGYGYSLLGDFPRAEDAAQDAFLQVYQDLPGLREPITFPHWLNRILFKCCDRITRRKQVARTSLEAAREVACPDTDPAEILVRAEWRGQVHAAIAGLPEAERTVITLFYIGEHSQSEISDFLQVPVTTVKKRLQRARARLQERIAMIPETLQKNAPSRNTRFVELSALLRRITDLLTVDTRVQAAYLAHFGDGEGFGPHDDAWSSLNIHIVVNETNMDDFAAGRLAFVSPAGKLLLYQEAPQNAPPQGYYMMAIYDGESGPYEVDWYWHSRNGAILPSDTRLLFDRAGLPVRDTPAAWGCLTGDQMPTALKRLRAARTGAEVWNDEARDIASLFWAMLLISAKYIARDPVREKLPFGGMLRNLLRDLRGHSGDTIAAKTRNAEDPTVSGVMAKLELLRALGAEMEALMAQASQRGAQMPTAVVPRAYAFLDLVGIITLE